MPDDPVLTEARDKQIAEAVHKRDERIDELEARVDRILLALRDCKQMADDLHMGSEFTFATDIRRRAEIALESAEDGDDD